MDIFGDLFNAIIDVLDPVANPPASALFVFIVGVTLSLFSTVVTVRMVDLEDLREKTEFVNEWRRKQMQAMKTMDPVLLTEVMAQRSRVLLVQSQVAQARMKPMCVFYLPMLIVFFLLGAVYGVTPVAILPFNIQHVLPFLDGWIGRTLDSGAFGLYFWSWYVLTSAGIGNIIRRAAGLV